MKLTAVLMLCACLQVAAKVNGQLVTLSVKDAPMKMVFREIQKQTGLNVIVNEKIISRVGKVTFDVRNKPVEQVLTLCFKDEALTYTIVDGTIVVKPKLTTETDMIADPVEQSFINIHGRVIDEQGKPLSAASVVVKNGTAGTKTDENGNFNLNADPGTVIVISYVGYEKKEIVIRDNNNSVVVSLSPQINSNESLVVIAYGAVRKKDLTGSVAKVNSKDLTAYPSTNVMQALNGRATGVQVMQNNGAPGSPISVRVRGVNSILGGNEPLYVVDGFPYSGNPTFLQNFDIESIEVLKDASSLAMYGSRGANGVVMISTRSGKKGTYSNVTFDASYSMQQVTKKMKLLSAVQYAELTNERSVNDGLTPYFTQAIIDSLSGVKSTDWQDLILRKAPIYSTNVTISQGNEKTRFSLSGGAYLQDGIVRRSDFKRYSLRGNINHDISKVFNVNYDAILTRITRNLQNSQLGNRGSDLFGAMLVAPPSLSPYNADGTLRNLSTAYPFMQMQNPMLWINNLSDYIKADRILSNLAFTIKPMPGLSIRISGGIENSNDRTDTYWKIDPAINSVGSAWISTNQFTNLLSENIANYNKTFGSHNLAVTAGFAYQVGTSTGVGASGTGFLSNVTSTGNLGAAATPGVPSSYYSKDVLASYISRVNYGFADKYLFTFSFRRDGSSRYSAANKWANFPSAAVAWRISNESFLEHSKIVSDLKLRASYGRTGSNSLSPYQTLNQLSSSIVTFGDAQYVGYGPGTNLPGNLKWETTDQLDIGADIGLLNDRIRFTADYYIKKTSNLLNRVQLPASTGYQQTVQNVGEIENKGFEFAVQADAIRTKDFKWNITGNISFNRNKVLKLYNGQDIFGDIIYTGAMNDAVNLLREGKPLGIFYGYVETGYTSTGNLQYKDLDSNGSINALDKTYIGDPNPDFIYGLNSVASYKGFELTLYIQGSKGNDIFNLNKALTLDWGIGLNQLEEIYDNHWTVDKTNTKYPKLTSKLNQNMSTRFVEDGSYLRFKNIQLAYNLPTDKMKLNWLKSAQLYVSGQNLVTITKYSWYDPEVNAYGSSNSIRQGIDYSIYPNSKSVTVGIRCRF